jgi:hypothetical protein
LFGSQVARRVIVKEMPKRPSANYQRQRGSVSMKTGADYLARYPRIGHHKQSSLLMRNGTGKKGWDAWVFAREEQWRGIVYSDVIIAAGFAIFMLSDFPPTRRFGLVVFAGCIIDTLGNLFVLPLLGGAQWKRKS